MGLSYSVLYQRIKTISGQPINPFIRSVRLRKAAVLMLKGELNITQCAFAVGIGDIKYFREQFVKLFGITPSDYIKKYRKNFEPTHNILKINPN